MTDKEALRIKAIEAFKTIGTITIETDADLTPYGKRAFRIVNVNPRRGRYAVDKGTPVIRWYVGGRIYRSLSLTQENIDMTREWVE